MERHKDETIIKQGPIKHKDTTIRFSLERWKPRIAVLKSLQAGRLQFVLVDNKRVEKYQVPIEDYAGIYINPKPDGNEKYSFAFISERTTDVFAFETEEAMKRWVDVIQERLGRVLIINITIPYRQHQLKQGLALLILRDNAIVITTKEQLPKFQCSILIRHIKHYGDFDDGFVFETGNKCPKGENTFLIRCANNKKLYTLLDSLTNRLTTVRDIVLKHEFSEIVMSQGSIPKTPLLPNTHSPSFNFGNLSSHLRPNKHENVNRKLRSVSDIPQSHTGHRPLTHSASVIPYCNMETGQENYQNIGQDGQSIVPEVEYEIIPDDVFMETRGIRPKRGSVPAGRLKNPDYLNLQIKSATMTSPSKSQRDSEYINIDWAVVQEPAVDSYANFQPISLSATKHSHESATEYVNLEFTESNSEHKIGASDLEPTASLPVDNASDFSSLKLERPTLGNGHIIQDEVDGITPCDSKNNTPKFLPSTEQIVQAEADVEYENLPTKTPSTTSDPSEYVMLSMVSVGQVTHQTNSLAAKTYKEIVSIKPPPAAAAAATTTTTTAASLPLEMATMSVSQHEPVRGYEDFVPVKTFSPAGSSLSTTVNTKQTATYKEYVPINTPTIDVVLPSGTTTEPAGQYEDFVPIKSPPAELPSENQYAHAAAYKEFVPIKTPPSTAQTSLPSEITSEPMGGYEDFVPIKTPSSTHAADTNNSEKHSTTEELNSHENDKEYSRLQFKGKEEPTIEHNNSTTYSTLVHSTSTESSTSDSFYSKLNVSEVSKTRHASLKDKPQIPSRNLKKPMKLYELSSNFVTTVIPPLPPRNRTVQAAADSPSSPPPAGPKPKSATPPLSPPIGPKPVTRDSRFPPELKYCDLEFTDIGQPKFRPRSKQLTDQSLSQHDAYAVIDRDASIGLQLALEQKKHDRR